MANYIYVIGLLVSIMGVLLWPVIIRSQIKQFNHNSTHNSIKVVLLIFGIMAFITNIPPGIYDFYRLNHPVSPGLITFLKLCSDIMFRATATASFFLIYTGDKKE